MNAPASGTILEFLAEEEDTVIVGQDLLKIKLGDAPEGGAKPAESAKSEAKEAAEPTKESPSKQEVKQEPKQEAPKEQPKPAPKAAEKPKPQTQSAPSSGADKGLGNREENRVSFPIVRRECFR